MPGYSLIRFSPFYEHGGIRVETEHGRIKNYTIAHRLHLITVGWSTIGTFFPVHGRGRKSVDFECAANSLLGAADI